MMSMAPNVLAPAGFHRYEVASYTKEGYECKHNIAYSTGVPYLGLGLSAVTMTQNDARRMRVQDGEVVDDLDRRQMAAEDLMMKMRMCRGVSEEEVLEAALLLPTVQETLGLAVARRSGQAQGRTFRADVRRLASGQQSSGRSMSWLRTFASNASTGGGRVDVPVLLAPMAA